MRDFYRGALKFLGVVALILLLAGAVLYGFFVRLLELGHNAMAPTIIRGDSVLVWRTTELDLGDVALCAHPREPGRFVVGRVVGRPGHMVGADAFGALTINGQAPARDLHEPIPFVDTETARRDTVVWADETILDHDYRIFMREGRRRDPRARPRERRVEGGVFLLSDNRTYLGEDSRNFGAIDPSTCVGRVFLRVDAAPSPPAIGNARLDIIE